MNALKEMLALAERPTAVVLKGRNTGTIPTIDQIANQGNQLTEKMFGIEESAKIFIENKMASLYPRLSLEPLTWRDKNGNPKLVIFSLDSPIFQIKVKSEGFVGKHHEYFLPRCPEISPQLPTAIIDCYKDIIKIFRQEADNGTSSKLTSQFEGIIPDNVKEKIKEAIKIFPIRNIFIIAEPNGWTMKVSKIKVDPLVVGWNENTKSLHLIADFDTTPVEESMIFEPTKKID